MPSGQSDYKAEIQFRLAIPNGSIKWDHTKDYSFKDLEKGGATPYITLYDGDTLIWGIEPDGTEPDLS